ncbi:MAG: AbrB/MazE/SpoVT family DNA-binding domain-containing protein [Candidatus Pacearchaeota archaeon]
MEVKTIARKWGNSIAIILPKNVVETGRINENDSLVVDVKRKVLAKEMFGKFPKWKSKKSAQELKDEMRKGWN